MKITFVLPGVSVSGGVRVVFEYANGLSELGHKVSVIYPLMPMSLGEKPYNLMALARRIYRASLNFFQSNKLDWFDLKADLIPVWSLSEKFIPEGDAIFATLWQTAYYVKKYSPNRGKKYYLIQHYETWCGPEKKVNESYKLGLKNIAVSNWIKRVVEERVGAKVDAVVMNGINLKQFFPNKEGRKSGAQVRILVPYRWEDWKGTIDGIKSFEIARKSLSKIKLVMFGPKPKLGEVPDYAEFHCNPTKEALRNIYASCDIFVFPSRHEGFGLPPMEAMACGCAVVATNVGGIPDYCIADRTALISSPNDIEGMAKNIIRFAENKKDREAFAQAGSEYIKTFGWAVPVRKMEELLKEDILRHD